MNAFQLFKATVLSAPLVVAFLCIVPQATVTGAETLDAADVDKVLQSWQQASEECRVFDAEITRIEYDRSFGKSRKTKCRFYYEAPGFGRLDIGGSDAVEAWRHNHPNPNLILDWRRKQSLIWSGDGLMIVDWDEKQYSDWTVAELASMEERLVEALKELSGWTNWFVMLAHWPALFSRPDSALPMVVNIRAERLRNRFNFTVEKVDGDFWLTAVPRHAMDKARFREIVIILDGQSFITKAIKLVRQDGNQEIVWVLGDPKINESPADRDRLLNPDIGKLRRANAIPMR